MNTTTQQHTPTPREADLLALVAESARLVGHAGKILEQMQEFWQHGTPIAAGSLLANEFSEWGQLVMRGPVEWNKDKAVRACNQHAALVAFASAFEERDGILYPVKAAELVALHRAALAQGGAK